MNIYMPTCLDYEHGELCELAVLSCPAEVHQLVDALATALDAKNPHTCGHSERVAELSRFLALKLGLSEAEAELAHIAGHLHDIGKIGVPDAILARRAR